jgi:AcrR family transcriptional regulator
MRAIATDAGVDAALIVHFFGTKAQLLTEAVEWPFDPEVRSAIMTLLRAATIEPAAAELLRDFLMRELFPPLMRELRVDEPELRANLAQSQLVGLGISRYVLRLQPLVDMTEDEVVRWVGPNLQRYLTGRAPA